MHKTGDQLRMNGDERMAAYGCTAGPALIFNQNLIYEASLGCKWKKK